MKQFRLTLTALLLLCLAGCLPKSKTILQQPGTGVVLRTELKRGARFDGLVFAPNAKGELEAAQVETVPAGAVLVVPKEKVKTGN